MLRTMLHWLADRFGWWPIKEQILDHRSARGQWYYSDGSTILFLILVQVVTGAVMMLTYSPSLEGAHESVRYITENQPLGWFVRAMHYWSAGMIIIMLLFHLFRQILLGGYKSPREGTWLLGVAMFFLLIVMSFTGYVLRWDDRALYGFRVALTMFYRLPMIGEPLAEFIQGGREINSLTITRVYAVHVIVVPLILVALTGYHLYLVLFHGVTTRTERRIPVETAEEQKEVFERDRQTHERGEVFFPETVARSGMFGAVVFGIVIALTFILGPAPLGPPADLSAPAYPAEEWWFAWYSSLIALLPPWIASWFVWVFPIALFVFLMALPFIDRGPYRGFRHRPIAVTLIILVSLGLIYLTGLRKHSPWTAWPSSDPPPVPAGVDPLPESVERGRQLFATYGCNSCHAIAGHGPQVGTDLAWMDRRYSLWELRNYILQPPPGVAMPSYEGRLTDEELDLIAGFVLVAQTFPRQQ